jgi:hypothetical protein
VSTRRGLPLADQAVLRAIGLQVVKCMAWAFVAGFALGVAVAWVAL